MALGIRYFNRGRAQKMSNFFHHCCIEGWPAEKIFRNNRNYQAVLSCFALHENQ